jgi:hypothetical protein
MKFIFFFFSLLSLEYEAINEEGSVRRFIFTNKQREEEKTLITCIYT